MKAVCFFSLLLLMFGDAFGAEAAEEASRSFGIGTFEQLDDESDGIFVCLWAAQMTASKLLSNGGIRTVIKIEGVTSRDEVKATPGIVIIEPEKTKVITVSVVKASTEVPVRKYKIYFEGHLTHLSSQQDRVADNVRSALSSRGDKSP